MNKSVLLILLGATLAGASAAERATYNSAGALTSLISSGAEIPIRAELVVGFEGGVRQSLQPHDQRSPITRQGEAQHWTGLSTFPNGGQAQFDATWADSADGGVAVTASVTSGGPRLAGAPAMRWPLTVESVDYVIDVPRGAFAGGRVEPAGTALPTTRPADPAFFRQDTARLELVDPGDNWRLSIALDQPRAVTITDRWNTEGRSFRIRIRLGAGKWPAGDAFAFGATLKLTGTPHPAPARIAVDSNAPRHSFAGFGGNYCFNTQTPAADFLLQNIQHGWARFELKAWNWDSQRSHPGPELTRDFELMQRVQQLHVPWILSVWRLPERYYSDPNQRLPGTFHRQIAADRWPEFLDLVGSYLVHLKQKYGAEPDLFSFNESDLGVDIGFSPETHRDMIKRVGAHLAALGLKTKLLLGDTANPRDSHKFVLATAADREAMSYVGALSVHSWGGGTPEQYGAWREVADWTGLPLIVAEAGTDPGSWRNRTFDSYAYGLGEIRQFQELLRDMQPQAMIYWQFTEDYGLVQVKSDGSIAPTGRYWLMRQLANFTPPQCEIARARSDQPDVLASAFVRDDAMVVHLLNTGAERDAVISGLPAGPWRAVVTTEDEANKPNHDGPRPDGRLRLAARSLTTLLRP